MPMYAHVTLERLLKAHALPPRDPDEIHKISYDHMTGSVYLERYASNKKKIELYANLHPVLVKLIDEQRLDATKGLQGSLRQLLGC